MHLAYWCGNRPIVRIVPSCSPLPPPPHRCVLPQPPHCCGHARYTYGHDMLCRGPCMERHVPQPARAASASPSPDPSQPPRTRFPLGTLAQIDPILSHTLSSPSIHTCPAMVPPPIPTIIFPVISSSSRPSHPHPVHHLPRYTHAEALTVYSSFNSLPIISTHLLAPRPQHRSSRHHRSSSRCCSSSCCCRRPRRRRSR